MITNIINLRDLAVTKFVAALAVVSLLLSALPVAFFVASADTANITAITIVTPEQAIEANESSSVITVRTVDADGGTENLSTPGTNFTLISSSATGEFSTNASFDSTVTSLSLNSGTANRNFFYRDSTPGTHTITIDSGNHDWGIVTQQIVVTEADAVPVENGTLRVRKIALGDAPLGNFEIVLTCGDDIVENITLGANGYRDIELASGLVCTVVENDTRGAVLVSYSPSDTVTIATNQQQQIDVINDYRTDEPVEPEEPTEPEEPVDPVIPTCNQGVNLIENGSFENPVISQDADGWDVFDSVINGLAWIVSWLNPTAESPDVAKLELQNGFTASEGVQYAELDANFSSIGAEFEGEDSRVVISQSIATIPGYTYSVNFDFAAIPAIPDAEERNVNSLPENNRMNVLVDGEVIRTVEADGSNDDDANWTSYTVTFVATTETTEIAFADAGLVDTFGTWLDNVRVYCVGENGGGETPTEPTNPTPNRGGGGYTPGERPGSTPDGEVLGDSISLPEGEVLGDQVTVVPTGAPNTGAGGTNYYFVAAALALAAFATRRLQIN